MVWHRRDGRGVVFVAPAGIEGFFDELGQGLADGLGQDEIRESLEGRFDSFPIPDPRCLVEEVLRLRRPSSRRRR
jgi:hypothetical protein